LIYFEILAWYSCYIYLLVTIQASYTSVDSGHIS